ncbi:MAG TPA: hypothetical protein VF253_09290 [Candidatus Limnocylindrales bacterium]
MIVRISRSRYAPDGEIDVFRSLQPLVDGRGRPPGLLDLVVGRRQVEDGLIEQTVITIWDSQAELAQGIEPAWDVPPDLDGAVSVEHLEIEAEDWPEFAALVKARARMLS